MYVTNTIISLAHSFSLTFHLFRDSSFILHFLLLPTQALKMTHTLFSCSSVCRRVSASKEISFLKIQGMYFHIAIKNPTERAGKLLGDF